MNKERAGVAGTMVSALLLLFTANPLWFLALIACSAFYGWNLGKRLFPAEEYGG